MRQDNKEKLKKIVIKLIIIAIILLSIFSAIYLILDYFNLTNIKHEQIKELIDKTGPWGPIVYIFIVFLQVTFIPLPGVVVILAGNIAFGFWVTLLYCFIGMMLGSILSFKLGRVFGRPFVNWIVGDKITVNQYLKKVNGKEFVVFFFMFLLPAFPDDALCALAGITTLKWPTFILMQLITRPFSVFLTLFFMSGEIIPYKGWGIVLIIVIAILSIVSFIICFKNADRINNYLDKKIERIKMKWKK